MNRHILRNNKTCLSSSFLTCVTGICLLVLIMSIPACRKKPEEESQTSKNPPVQQIEEKELLISTFPKDGGFIWHLENPFYISFSQTIFPKDLIFTISPDPGGWSTTWEKEGKKAVLNHTTPFKAGTTYELELHVKSFQVKKTVRFTAYGPSSIELIDGDERKGVLDLDTAWIFRLQRLLEPSQLPVKYKSPTPIKCGTHVWKGFNRIRDELKPETLKRLRPYLVRPNHPESIINQKIKDMEKSVSNKKQPGTGLLVNQAFAQQEDIPKRPENMWGYEEWLNKIRIWYRKGHKTKAERAWHWLETETMWQDFKELLGREPITDFGYCRTCDSISDPVKKERCMIRECGGDGKLDIYLVPPTEEGLDKDDGACVALSGNIHSPTFIVINQDLGESPKNFFGGTIAHELFHSFQDHFSTIQTATDLWWVEGTAMWAENYIDESWDTERGEGEEFVELAFNKEEKTLITLTSEENQHEYAAYLFPFYMTYVNPKDVSLIRTIWEGCEKMRGIDATEIALKGNFREIFRKFALLNYDDTSAAIKEEYPETLDVINYHGFKEFRIKKAGKQEPIKVEVPPLGAKYYRIYNDIPNKRVTPHVCFDLEAMVFMHDLSIYALFDPESGEKPEDWTGLNEKSLCVNFADDDFKYLVLSIANHNRDETVFSYIGIDVNADRCIEGDAIGKVSLNHRINTFNEWSDRGASGFSRFQRNMEVTVYAQFEYDRSHYYDKKDEIRDYYKLKSWEVISSGGTMKEDRYHESSSGHGTYKSIASGRGYKDPEMHHATSTLEVLLDAKTGKSKSVKFPNFSASIRWTGKWKQTEVHPDHTSQNGGEIDKAEHIFRVDNLVGDKSVILKGGILEGLKVDSGGRGQMSGRATHVLKDSDEGKVQLHTNWHLRVMKGKKKED